MFEYGAVLAGDFRQAWASEILPLLETILSSPYFWPAIAAVAVTLFMFVRQFTR